MVTAHLAVVAGHDDQRRLGQTAALEVREQWRQAVVDLALRAVVGGAQLPAIPLVVGRTDTGHAHRTGAQWVHGRLLLACRTARERTHRVGRIQVVIAERVAARAGADG